jgi:hypothetical protein
VLPNAFCPEPNLRATHAGEMVDAATICLYHGCCGEGISTREDSL